MTHARFLRRQAAMRHGEQRPLTRDEIAQIPPERLRAIVAAGLVQAAMREVAQIEARLLQRSEERRVGKEGRTVRQRGDLTATRAKAQRGRADTQREDGKGNKL